MIKRIYTHNGMFHADEVTAVALLEVFLPGKYEILRVPHQTTTFPEGDYMLDIGRDYDDRTKFDHHQWEKGLSTAGLMWKHINLKGYTKIDTLMEHVDAHDVGARPATQCEFSRLVSTYNHIDIYSKQQDVQFLKAVNFVIDIITSYRNTQEILNASKEACETASSWGNSASILNLGEWRLGWTAFINGETRPDIEAVVWEDKHLNTWNIRTTNVSMSSYERVGRKLMPWNKMNFVHANGFFAVASSKEILLEYTNKYMK